MAEVEQKLQPSGQPTDGMIVAATSPRRSFAVDAQVPRAEARGDHRMAQRPVLVLAQEAAEPAHALAADDVIGVDPLGQVGHVGDVPADDDRGVRADTAGSSSHIFFTFSMFGMIDEMPMTSYWRVRISSMKRSSVGKSSSVQGASMFAWIIIRPQLRWNIRSENAPCVRVTWLW